jgi:hypothetical protein
MLRFGFWRRGRLGCGFGLWRGRRLWRGLVFLRRGRGLRCGRGAGRSGRARWRCAGTRLNGLGLRTRRLAACGWLVGWCRLMRWSIGRRGRCRGRRSSRWLILHWLIFHRFIFDWFILGRLFRCGRSFPRLRRGRLIRLGVGGSLRRLIWRRARLGWFRLRWLIRGRVILGWLVPLALYTQARWCQSGRVSRRRHPSRRIHPTWT